MAVKHNIGLFPPFSILDDVRRELIAGFLDQLTEARNRELVLRCLREESAKLTASGCS